MDEDEIQEELADYGDDLSQDFTEDETEEELAPEDEAEAQSDPAPAPAVATAANRQPQFATSPNLQATIERAREMYGDEAITVLNTLVQEQVSHSLRAHTYAGTYVQQAQQQMPGYFQVHQSEIASVLAELPSEQRATPGGAVFAMLAPLMRQANETGDVAGALRSFAELMAPRQEAQAQPRQQQRREMPPPVRTPSPTKTGGAPPVRTSGDRQAESAASMIADLYGVPAESARKMGAYSRNR